MQIVIAYIENPNQEFWIWHEKITNKSKGRIYPSTISSFNSGKSVAIYKIDDNNIKTQISQLILPDYKKLSEAYRSGKKVNLDYTYIDDFSWLGDKLPYEVEMFPYTKREQFCARCSFWNNTDGLNNEHGYVHIMQSQFVDGYVDFSYAAFYNINLDLCNIKINSGNLWFDNARFYHSHITLGPIVCNGDQLFAPEISFRYITAEDLVIDTMLMSQMLSMDFLCAKTNDTTINLDPLPAKAFRTLCFSKATINKVSITNAEIDSLSIWEADINSIEFKRCKFLGLSEIYGNIHLLRIDSCVNSNVFQISLPVVVDISFCHTINNGKFCFSNFESNMLALLNPAHFNPLEDTGQLLMLKENFRQTGEYRNEDICHLQHHRLVTKKEKNLLKKFGRYFLDAISGYGTKPFRAMFAILFTIICFGSIYYIVPTFSYAGASTWLEHIYVSGITFFSVGYGDIFPLNIITKIVSLVEAFLGVTATSYFLVLLSRKVIR